MKLIHTKEEKRRPLFAVLLGIAFLVTVLAIITGSYMTDKEQIVVGQVSPKRYVAERDMENRLATEKLRQEARESVGNLYKQDDTVAPKTLEDIRWFFGDMDSFLESMTDAEGAYIKTYQDAVFKIPVTPTNRQFDRYAALSVQGKETFLENVQSIAETLLERGFTEENKEKTLALAEENLASTAWDQDLQALGLSVLSETLHPNLVLDEGAMTAMQEQKAAEVAPVMLYQNQKIVDQGEIITQDIFDLLVELNLINQNYTDSIVPFIGAILLTLMLFGAVVLYFQGKRRSLKTNEALMLFVAYVVTVGILRLTANMGTYVFIPMSLFAMLVSILLNSRMAITLNIGVVVVGALIFNGNIGFLVYFLVTGTLAALLMPYTEQRNRILPVCLAVGLCNFLAYFSIGVFLEGGYNLTIFKEAMCTLLTGMICVVVAVGSLPLWEAGFEANTALKLLELTNPNSELLRRLMIEAPGTYHHSLIVANLAETAAYEIGANSTLARVGAYYHDVGKLKYPIYFGENQNGENPHKNLMPDVSARMIREHTVFGRELAGAYHLPKAVTDMAAEHHGTSLIKYFYVEACKCYGEAEVSEADYRYHGPIPRSRESALVMLADTVEAAVRSRLAAGEDAEAIEGIIAGLIKDKLDDGQLADSELTIKDLVTIRKAFLKVFHGLYHDRVTYPKEEELLAIRESKGEVK